MGRGYCAAEDAPLDSAGLLRCRNAMMDALRGNRLDDLKQIVEKAEKLKKKTVQKTPEQIYQEQQKMNDNQEKMIEVYSEK